VFQNVTVKYGGEDRKTRWAAQCLRFAWPNFVRIHSSLRVHSRHGIRNHGSLSDSRKPLTTDAGGSSGLRTSELRTGM
jgi:hypothetical protein